MTSFGFWASLAVVLVVAVVIGPSLVKGPSLPSAPAAELPLVAFLEPSVHLSRGRYGRGLFAGRSLARNTTVLCVSTSALPTPSVRGAIDPEISSAARSAMGLCLWEKTGAAPAAWGWWARSFLVDTPAEDYPPSLWSDDELKELQFPVASSREAASRNHALFPGPVRAKCPLADFQRVYALAQTRWFGADSLRDAEDRSQGNATYMFLPGIDYANAASKPEEVNVEIVTDPGNLTHCLVTTAAVARGGELLLDYGRMPSRISLGTYGFLANIDDDTVLFTDANKNRLELALKRRDVKLERALCLRLREVLKALPTGLHHDIALLEEDFRGGQRIDSKRKRVAIEYRALQKTIIDANLNQNCERNEDE
jgi:hypothetical protein